MPTYAYRCTVCGNEFDVKQSFSDDALTVCPTCGGGLRKLFSSVGVVFKGAGFYHNDSRSTTTSTTAGAPAATEKAGTTASPAPAGSTPAAATSSSSSTGSSASAAG
ncbi:FmdB family zinc ribbon protein [Georgenia sp. SYP-B2076]|uniref:FmdB family zinc ribbon protein n=1 Tax=Georgenia sp. SYP-B2076 TaxID=2495881 RepID=UPI000F8E2C0F|nr:FmdB family zinc ribbon protein [Georgenia sp. SYP-B2076]